MEDGTTIGKFVVDLLGMGFTAKIEFRESLIPVYFSNGRGGVKQSRQSIICIIGIAGNRYSGVSHCSPDEKNADPVRGMSIALDRALDGFSREGHNLIKKAFRAWLTTGFVDKSYIELMEFYNED